MGAGTPPKRVGGHVECEGLPKVKFVCFLKAQLDFRGPRRVARSPRMGARTPPERTLAAPGPRSVLGRAFRASLGVTWGAIWGPIWVY